MNINPFSKEAKKMKFSEFKKAIKLEKKLSAHLAKTSAVYHMFDILANKNTRGTVTIEKFFKDKDAPKEKHHFQPKYFRILKEYTNFSLHNNKTKKVRAEYEELFDEE